MYQLTDQDRQRAQQRAQQMFAQNQPAQPEKKGNFLTSLLPTAGGILGGIGGSFLAPGLGTAAGGAAGAGLGKTLQNMLTGEKNIGKGVLGEAALGTLGGIGKGFRAVKGAAGALKAGQGVRSAANILKMGVPKATTAMAGQVAGSGASKIAQSIPKSANALASPVSKFSVSGQLKDMGNKSLLSQYGTISKPVARQTNPTRTIGALADAGIIKSQDAQRVATKFTGTNGIVNKAVLEATGKAKNVDTSTLRQVFNDALDNYGVVDKDRDSLSKVFNAQLNRLSGGARGSLSSKVNASEALSTIKSFEKRIADLGGKGGNYRMMTPERADQASVLKLVRDELQDQLYVTAGANKNLKQVLTPKLRQQLVDLMPNNPKWSNYVDKNVMSSKDIGQLRSSMSPFVNVSKIIDEGDINAITFGGRAGNAIGGLKDSAMNILHNLTKGPVAQKTGQALRSASESNLAFPNMNIALPNAAKIAGTQLLGRGLTGNLPGAQPDTSQMDSSINQAMQGMGGSPMMGGMPGAGEMTGMGGMSSSPQQIYSRDAVAKDIQADLQRTGGANMDKYITLYNFLNPEGGGTKANATTQRALSQSANADSTLGQLETMFAQAGGGSGRVGGWLSGLMGNVGLNEDAKVYNNMASGSVAQIAKALGETGVLSDSDIRVYSSMIPKITDNPQEAARLFKALRQRMATSKQNTLTYGAGDGIAEALAGLY